MTEFIIDAEDVVVDHLRVNLTDPRSRAEDTSTKNVTATAGQTEIEIDAPDDNTVSCVTSLTVNGTAKSKWKDYHWDYQNEKVTLFDSLSVGDSVVINYKYGSTNWIYSDRPDYNLSSISFPRISVMTLNAPGKRLGQYKAPIETSYYFQIDIWCKDSYVYTSGDNKYSNIFLARYLGNRIGKTFEDNESELFPLLYNYVPISGVKNAPYSERYQAFHVIKEVNFKTLRAGRIEIS